MGYPTSLVRKLIGRAAKNAIEDGLIAKKATTFTGPLSTALMRQAALSSKTERGFNQLSRIRALLEAQPHPEAASLLTHLNTADSAVSGGWRNLMATGKTGGR